MLYFNNYNISKKQVLGAIILYWQMLPSNLYNNRLNSSVTLDNYI